MLMWIQKADQKWYSFVKEYLFLKFEKYICYYFPSKAIDLNSVTSCIYYA